MSPPPGWDSRLGGVWGFELKYLLAWLCPGCRRDVQVPKQFPKSPSWPGLQWAPPSLPKSPIPGPREPGGVFGWVTLGCLCAFPTRSPPSHGPHLPCTLPNLDTCRPPAPAPHHPRDKCQRWGWGRMMAEPKSAGHVPACPALRSCHCWGPCRELGSHQGWWVPIRHVPRSSWGRQQPWCQPRGIDRLLKSTVGRMGKGDGKGKRLQANFITNQMAMS